VYRTGLHIQGTGEPIVLVPGLDGTGLLFYRQVPALARRFQVATFRLRDDASTMADLIADLEAVVDHLAPDRRSVSLVGESFGGALSLSFAIAHPGRVSRLVILNSFAHFTPQVRLWLGYHLLHAMPWGMMAVVRRLTAWRLHSAHTQREELERFHALMRETRREGYLSRLRILRGYDVRARLHEIEAPTLFLAADQDHLVPSVAQAELMRQEVPRASVRVLQGHGHICLLAPDLDLAQIIGEWEAGPGAPDAPE
jgi:pimeloyl-ACP methyl ester carboxylesterase